MEWVNKIINMVCGYQKTETFSTRLLAFVEVTPELIETLNDLKQLEIVTAYRAKDSCSCVIVFDSTKTTTSLVLTLIGGELLSECSGYGFVELPALDTDYKTNTK